jgi:hypothetical protein
MKTIERAMRRLSVCLCVMSAAVLAGCGAGRASPTLPPTVGTGSSGGNGSRGSAPGKVIFTIQVNFTGADPVSGSFTDPETGSGFSSCSQYGNQTSTLAGWTGPGAQAQQSAQVQGKSITMLMTIQGGVYHGPGRYANPIKGVTIGSDDFYIGNSSVTVNADGSGTATFMNLTSPLANGSESGTYGWTCSG